MNTTQAIRKGIIVVPNLSDYTYSGNMEDMGVAGRLRTLGGMQRELGNRKKAIKQFEKQLSAAKEDWEKTRLQKLIAKYKKKVKDLTQEIAKKKDRKAGRKRLGKRIKTRVGIFSGPFSTYDLIDYDEGLSGAGAYWSRYRSWWSEQNPVVQIAVPGLFLLGSFKLVQALTKKGKGKK
jgi:hypothetical protein